MNTDVVIPAAGLGSRMGEYTQNQPKCLVELDDHTLLEHQLTSLTDFGIPRSSIHVVIGAKGECWTQSAYERIRSIHDNVIINFENTTKGPGFSVKLGLERITSNSVMILDGDIILVDEVLTTLLESDHSAVVSKLANDRAEPGSKVVTDESNSVIDMGKEINPESFPWNIYSGICKLTGEELSIANSYFNQSDSEEQSICDMIRYVSSTGTVYNKEFNWGWENVNRPEELTNAQEVGQR